MENNINKTESSTTIDENIEAIDELSILKVQYADLQKRFDVIYEEFKLQNSLYLRTFSDGNFATLLKNTTDYNAWFRFLPEACRRFLVVLTIKDTPGDCMPDLVYKTLVESGFTNIRKDLWNTYVGVIYQNSVWCNDRHANEEKTSYTYESLDRKFTLAAYSESWKNGNRGDISINGDQLSVNIRGLNIVIYNLKNSEIVDSIGFDSHVVNNLIFLKK